MIRAKAALHDGAVKLHPRMLQREKVIVSAYKRTKSLHFALSPDAFKLAGSRKCCP